MIYNQRDMGNYSPNALIRACGGSLFGATIPQAWDNKPIFYEFNPETLETVRQWNPGFLTMATASSPDGDYIYVAGSAGIARFNCQQREFDINRAGEVSPIQTIAVDPAGRYIYAIVKVTDSRRKLARFSTTDLSDTRYYDDTGDYLLPDAYFGSLVISPDGKRLYTVSDDNSGDLLDRDRSVVYAIDISGPTWSIAGQQELAFSGFNQMAITPDGRYLYTTNSGSLSASEITELATDPLKITGSQSGEVNGLQPVTVSADGKWMYTSGGGNPTVLMRSAVGPTQPQWDKRINVPGENPGLDGIVVSPDGRTVWQATKGYLSIIKYGLPDNCDGRNRFVYPWICEQDQELGQLPQTDPWPHLLRAYREDKLSAYYSSVL